MQMAVGLAAIFALVCFGVAINGFVSLGTITDPTKLADGQGFAWFWAFLGSVAAAFGLLGWWLMKTAKPDDGA